MIQKTKKTISVLLSLLMVLSVFGGLNLTAYAEELSESFETNKKLNTYTGEHFTIWCQDKGGNDGFYLMTNPTYIATISSRNGEIITKAEFTRGWYNINNFRSEAGTVTYDGDVATVTGINATSLTIGAAGRLNIKAVKVYWAHFHDFTYAAKADLDALLDGKTEADYDAEDWAALTQAITDGKAAIDTATTIDDVTAAKTTAIQNAPVIKTTAEKLADAKTAALEELQGYAAADAYREAQQITLADALATGYGEIDEAETIAEVEAALAAAKEVIDAIPTDAELTAEEEAAAAEAAANQAAADAVKEKIAAIGEVEYTDDSKAKIDEARAAYDALTDAQKALVDNADVLIAAETAYAEAKAAAETPDEPTEPDDATENLCFNCGKDHGNNKLAKIICWVVYFVKTMIIKIIPGVKDIIK